VIQKLYKLDTWVLLIVACLGAAGTLAVYGATHGTKLNGLHWTNMILFGCFSVPMLLIALIDYRIFLGKASYFFYGIGIVMLVVVKFKGVDINGAARWLSIGHFQLQPSELVKMFTIFLAAHLMNKREGQQLKFWQDIIPLLIIFIIPMYLIMAQPDLGTALVFVGIFLSMLWIGNIRMSYMLTLITVLTLIIGSIFELYYHDLTLLTKFVKPHQMARIQTFLDPTSDPNKSWHVKHAMDAIGSGGLSGDDGFYVNGGYIPYAYSDSIFAVIGEKYGFVGAAALLLIYYLLIYRMILIAIESRDLIGSFLVLGIAGMFVFQIFVNIGMHIGLLPLTGISIPFISYGGSSLLTNMVGIGLVLSVKTHKDRDDRFEHTTSEDRIWTNQKRFSNLWKQPNS
jgi:rod shape determining protein RodA